MAHQNRRGSTKLTRRHDRKEQRKFKGIKHHGKLQFSLVRQVPQRLPIVMPAVSTNSHESEARDFLDQAI